MPMTARRSAPCSTTWMGRWRLHRDGAYDRDDVYAEVVVRHPVAAVVVPPRASAVPSEAAETAPTRRDAHLRCIAERGRLGWQKASGYNWRALVECDISRRKRVIGDGLRSQTDGRQAIEVAIAADVLNRMLDRGRPDYVRIACPGTRVGLSALAPPIRATRWHRIEKVGGQAEAAQRLR